MDEKFYRDCASGFAEKFGRHMRTRAQEDPLLGKVKTVTLAHGPNLIVHQEGGTVDDSKSKDIEVRFALSMDVIESGDADAFLAQIESGTVKLREAMVKQLLQKADEVCEATGNIVDGSQRPLSSAMIYEMLEQVGIGFDDNGHPIMPSLVCHPSQAPEFQAMLDDPVTKMRISEILLRKYFERYSL